MFYVISEVSSFALVEDTRASPQSEKSLNFTQFSSIISSIRRTAVGQTFSFSVVEMKLQVQFEFHSSIEESWVNVLRARLTGIRAD